MRRFLPTFASILALLAGRTASAEPNVLVNDTFADGERATQILPGSLAWYTTSAARPNLAVRSGALTLVANNNDRPVWGYFPTTALQIGESLTLTVDFSLTRTQPNLGSPSFKIALCFTNGVALRNSDGGTPTGNYQGYGQFTNAGDATSGTRIRKRGGPAAGNATATLLEVTDGPTDVIWDTFGVARSGLAGILQGSTPYTAVLRVTRTGLDTASVTTSITGGALGAANTLTEEDTSRVFSTFDTVTIGAAESTQAGDLLVSRVNLVHETNGTRLGNLSILASLLSGGDSLTLGYAVGGRGTTGAKPLVIRAAGPALGALGVSGTLEDPRIELYAGATKSGENDNWGGDAAIQDAMARVGAFPFPGPTSRDSAVVTSITGGGNSVVISSANNGRGDVLAELYDATPEASVGASTPRLVNLSVLKQIGTGLTVGFYVGGTGTKTVLVRAVGPTLGLAPFNLPGTVPDPQLTLFNGPQAVAANDNWGGTPALTAAFAHVAAFALPAASRDAALIATLAPGSYTVRVAAVGGITGNVLIEVYEVQ